MHAPRWTSQAAFLVQGSEEDVAGQTLFLHLQQGTTVGQVVMTVSCHFLPCSVVTSCSAYFTPTCSWIPPCMQVVAMCNEVAGRTGHQQRISGRLRPLHFATPNGRVDWDPVTEVPAFFARFCMNMHRGSHTLVYAPHWVMLCYKGHAGSSIFPGRTWGRGTQAHHRVLMRMRRSCRRSCGRCWWRRRRR